MSEPKDISTPLVVDLDHTLIRTDLLFEMFWRGMGVDPLGTLRTVWQHRNDRSQLKSVLAERYAPDAGLLPVDPDVEALCQETRAAGRPVVLASGSAEGMVSIFANHHGPFDEVIATASEKTETSAAKAERLKTLYGNKGFDYIGDNGRDIPVWAAARKGYVARPTSAIQKKAAAAGLELEAVGTAWDWKDLVHALRPHQWVKNVLLFLPLIAAHSVDPVGILMVLAGIVSFSAAASAIYIVNDLTDIEADRQHETKKKRVFAAGQLPIQTGMVVSVGLGLFALLLAALISQEMLAVIAIYIAATLAYSMRLKRERWVDVATLASLYTLRAVAGAVAAEVETSGWLIGFIFPIFLTLACVKRLTELSKAPAEGMLPGRRYSRADRQDILNVAILSAIASIAVFLGYSNSDVAALLYDSKPLLQAMALPLGLWQLRMIWTGWTGSQAYDPIVFALRDWVGLTMVAAAVVLLVLASTQTAS